MNCGTCGTHLGSEATYCPGCGGPGLPDYLEYAYDEQEYLTAVLEDRI